MLKKTVLSGFVVIAFIIYSVQQRHEGARPVVALAPPKQLSNGGAASTTPPSSSPTPASSYKDGQYTGTAADAYYGYIQVKATIAGGKITAVEFLQSPNDQSNSVRINQQAMPYLQQEAIQAQSAQVDGVSGATDTSQAFIQSLSSALDQAKS